MCHVVNNFLLLRSTENFGEMLLEDLVHSEMDPLDNVPAVVEDPANIFRVHGAGEVGVAVVGAVLLGVSRARLLADLEKIVSYEVFGPGELFI